MMKYLFLLLALTLSGASQASYWGEEDSITVGFPGCNVISNQQIPGQTNLFIGRALFTPTGQPIAQKCSTPAGTEAGNHNRMGMVLNQMNWTTNSLSIVKGLFAPQQGPITAGPLKGQTFQTAFDPLMAIHNNQYLVAFQCEVGGYSASSCLAVYNPTTQTIAQSTMQLVVAENKTSTGHISAAVPGLVSFGGSLYMYWSAVYDVNGTFTRIAIRAAQLQADANGYYWVKGANGKIALSTDPTSVEVWSPATDSMSNTAADLKSIWVSGNSIVAVASLGGSGCSTAHGNQPGCWRMGMKAVTSPLASFNNSPLLDAALLPTNGQGYTRPMKLPSGTWDFLGIFNAPVNNGFSNLRPVPESWSGLGSTNYTAFGFQDSTLWPH